MLARRVLDLAEEQGLLDGKAIAELRRKLGETKFVVTPEAIAKVLVDSGHLTAFQARKLVAQALGSEAEAPARTQPGVKRVAPPKRQLPETIEMTLAEEAEQKTAPPTDEIIDLEAVEPQPMPLHRGPAWKTDPVPDQDDDFVDLDSGAGLQPLPTDPLSRRNVGGAAQGPWHGGRVLPARPAKNVWDSPLLLVGGGVLGIVLVAFAVLLYALTRGTAAELLKQADEAYRSGVYTSAIAGYDQFLKKYPDNPEASKARVFRGMARVRQVSDDGKNPRLALTTARQVLPQIEKEEQFNLARPELSTILPAIADGFATLAGQTNETETRVELVNLAGDAMELVNNPSYLPSSLRREREQRIASVLDKLKVVRRSIDQDKELAAAVEKIKAQVDQGDASGAYQVRAELLRSYPGLETHPQLQAATRRIGEKEQEVVRVAEPNVAARTDDPYAENPSIVLALREGPMAQTPVKRPALMLIEGAVYALDPASGKLLWRRHVGYETTVLPLAMPNNSSADAVLVDGRRQEVIRLVGATGKLAWRQRLDHAVAGSVIVGQQVVTTTRRGRLLQIDGASGQVVREAQLPQGATVAAALDAKQQRLLQLGEHSTLFVLEAESLACRETVYLGHKKGAIFVPPVSVLEHIFVCESPGDDYSFVHVLAIDAKTRRLAAIGRPFRLKGRVVTPLVVSGRRVAAMTDLGQIAVYEVDAGNAQQPVRLIAGIEASESSPLLPYYALSGNRLWTATKRRTLLEVQASLQQLARRWSQNQGDSFIAPLEIHDDLLIYARRSPGTPAVLVEACQAATGQPVWTTHLAAPIVALVAAPARAAVDILTAAGRVYSLSADKQRESNLEQPAITPPMGSGAAILPHAVAAPDGSSLVWTDDGTGGRIYTYLAASGGVPTATPLPAGARAAAAAQGMGGRLLVPLTNGSVVLLEHDTGKQAAAPFLPPIAPGELPLWTRPAVRADGKGFLIGDGRGSVYAVAVKEQPQPHLAATATTPTAGPVISPLVMVGGTAFGVMRTDNGDALVGFDGQASPAFEPLALKGRVQAGPFAMGGLVLVAAEADGLVCAALDGTIRWQQPLLHGPLAGAPLVTSNGDLLVLYQSGMVARVSAQGGKEIAVADVGQPLGGAACILGNELLVAGSDGVVHRVPIPGA